MILVASGGPGNYYKETKGSPWFKDGKKYNRPVGAYSTDLISASLDELEASMPYVQGTRIIETDEFRRDPSRTSIPHFTVDAVVHAPFGAWYFVKKILFNLGNRIDDWDRGGHCCEGFDPDMGNGCWRIWDCDRPRNIRTQAHQGRWRANHPTQFAARLLRCPVVGHHHGHRNPAVAHGARRDDPRGCR